MPKVEIFREIVENEDSSSWKLFQKSKYFVKLLTTKQPALEDCNKFDFSWNCRERRKWLLKTLPEIRFFREINEQQNLSVWTLIFPGRHNSKVSRIIRNAKISWNRRKRRKQLLETLPKVEIYEKNVKIQKIRETKKKRTTRFFPFFRENTSNAFKRPRRSNSFLPFFVKSKLTNLESQNRK